METSTRFAAIPADHPERPAIEAFIRKVVDKAYGAQVQHFAKVLLGIKGRDGEWVAAMGFTGATGHALFVEN